MPKRTPVPTGRPRLEPTPADIAQLEQWAHDGLAINQMARGLGVSIDTLTRWRERHEAVAEALELGREKLHLVLKSKLIEKALAGETVPLLFALKVFFGYREGEPIPTVQITNSVMTLSPREVQEIVQVIAAEV